MASHIYRQGERGSLSRRWLRLMPCSTSPTPHRTPCGDDSITNSLGEVNAALRELFETFVLQVVEHPDTEDGHWHVKPTVRRLFIQPVLLGSLGERITEHRRGIELESHAPTGRSRPA